MANRKVRFSVATLLGLMALVAVVLAHAKWKRKHLINERAALTREMIGIAYEETGTGWIEYLATNKTKTQKPTRAAFRVYQDGDNIRVGNLESKRVGRNELEARMGPLVRRLINLGVEQLSIIVYYEDEEWWKQAMPIVENHGFENFYQKRQMVEIRGRNYWIVDASQKLK